MATLRDLFMTGEYRTWWRFFSWRAKNYLQRMAVHYCERLNFFSYNAWRKKQTRECQGSPRKHGKDQIRLCDPARRRGPTDINCFAKPGLPALVCLGSIWKPENG